jgi:hypothetical protein
MKVNILLLTLIVGVCWAAPADNLVPWTSTTRTEVIQHVPYKIDSEVTFSNKTMKGINSVLNNKSKYSSWRYKEVEGESIYVLITSDNKCMENRVNNVILPSHVVIACIKSYARGEIHSATRTAVELHRRVFHPEEAAKKNSSEDNEDEE